MLLLHPEVGAAVLYEHVVFLEGTLVQQHRYAFPSREFAFLVLSLDTLFAATESGRSPALNKSGNVFLLYAHIYLKYYWFQIEKIPQM